MHSGVNFGILKFVFWNEEKREEEIQQINESKNDKRLRAIEEEISWCLCENVQPMREKPD